MTAIAGVIGAPDTQLNQTCRSILQPLRGYGDLQPTYRKLAGAEFGCALVEQLPEDPFDGKPIVHGDRFMLVADLRLDNRDELLSGIGPALPRPQECSDARILLHAWIRWGDNCLDRVVGDFAFALWDSAERRLALARDPTGQRPLFYAQGESTVAFASMPTGLLNGALARGSFHFERLATMLLGITDVTEATYFDGISRVLPGHVTVFGPHRVTRTYWVPSTEQLRLTDSQFVEAYHEQLEQAVRPRLRRMSGGIGVHLSSGYDSSAVAVVAARMAEGAKPIAFTSAPMEGFNGPVQRGRIADESALAAQTAKMHGLLHVVVRPSGGVLEPLRKHAHLYQEPDRNVINMEWWTAIHSAAREVGVSTLLVGQLGNLTIHAGGLPVLAEWVRRGDWREWWQEAHAAAGSSRARWRGILINSFESSLGASLVGPIYRLFLGVPLHFEHSYLQEYWLRGARAKAFQSARDLLEGGPYQRRLTLIRTQDIGVFRKGALGESRIDERDPTADRRLIEFSLRLPPEQLLHRGEWRPLARRALAGHLPNGVLDLRTRGYQGADWFERFSRAEAQTLIEEISTSSTVNKLLDLRKIRKDVERWPVNGSASLHDQIIYRNRLLTALSTGVFLQEFEPLLSASGESSFLLRNQRSI